MVKLSVSELAERAGDGSGTSMLAGSGGLHGVLVRGFHLASIAEVLLDANAHTI